MKRLGKFLAYTVMALLAVAVGVTAFVSLAARSSPDRIPTVYGHKILNVVSGSMEPELRAGDSIIVRPLAAGETPMKGEIVTFRARDAQDRSKEILITHRVVGELKIDGRSLAWVTRGDANDGDDLTPVARESIVGIYETRIPYLGILLNFVRSPIGVLTLLILPGLALVLREIRKIRLILQEAGEQGG
jgi:signal peptidase I